jgi:hypothetical protein
MVRDGLVEVAFDCREHWPHPRHSVVTIDRADFKVYRRNKRETIPVLCPPGK